MNTEPRGTVVRSYAIERRTQERILLRFIKSMYFIDEQDRPWRHFRFIDDFAYILHAGADGTQRVERFLHFVCNDVGDSGLSDARWPP